MKETRKENLPPPPHLMPPIDSWSFLEEVVGRGGVVCLMHLSSLDSIFPLDLFRIDRYSDFFFSSLNSGIHFRPLFGLVDKISHNLLPLISIYNLDCYSALDLL
jgi:hypothetical protein